MAKYTYLPTYLIIIIIVLLGKRLFIQIILLFLKKSNQIINLLNLNSVTNSDIINTKWFLEKVAPKVVKRDMIAIDFMLNANL